MRRTLTMVTGEHLPHSGQLSFSLRCQICNNTHHTCLPMVLMCSCVYVYVCVCTMCFYHKVSVVNNRTYQHWLPYCCSVNSVFFFSPPSSVSPAGYPCALVYRRFLFYQPATVIHLFHTFSGLALAAFNFGEMKRDSEGLCYYAAVYV